MKKVNTFILSLLLVTSAQNILPNNISIEDQIHTVVAQHQKDLQTLNSKNFDVFKNNLLNIFSSASTQEQTKYKTTIQALKNLSIQELKQIQKALAALNTILQTLRKDTAMLIYNSLPMLVQKMVKKP